MPVFLFDKNKFKPGYGGVYDGEKIPGDLYEWLLCSSDPNYIVSSTYGFLCDRSNTLYHTHPLARGAINRQVDYIVGPGLVFKSQPDWRRIPWMRESTAQEWAQEFQRVIHYYFTQFSFYEKQAISMRSAMSSGDSLYFFIRENGALQDIIESGGNEIDWQYDREDCTLGIKHDKYLRRTGIRKLDGTDVNFTDSLGDQNVLQILFKELPRQLRGFPLVYSVINAAKNDDRHQDATIARAALEALLVGSFSSDTVDFTKQAANMAKANTAGTTPKTTSVLSRIGNAFKLGTGNIFTTNKGDSLTFTDLKTPSNNYGMLKDWNLNYFGAATGTPPEFITGNIKSSFTAYMGSLNLFKKVYLYKRAVYFNKYLTVVIRECAKDAIMKGYIKAPGFFENPLTRMAYLQGNVLGPIPGTVNPGQEVKALKDAVEACFMPRSDAAESLNTYEWSDMINQWAIDEKKFYEAMPEKQADAFSKDIEKQGAVE